MEKELKLELRYIEFLSNVNHSGAREIERRNNPFRIGYYAHDAKGRYFIVPMVAMVDPIEMTFWGYANIPHAYSKDSGVQAPLSEIDICVEFKPSTIDDLFEITWLKVMSKETKSAPFSMKVGFLSKKQSIAYIIPL